MIFSPHILQQKVLTGGGIINGNPVPSKEDWVEVGECRCDDNDAREKININGILRDYNYHIVYEGEKLSIGTEVRVIDKSNCSLRGSGIVIRPKKCNYFEEKSEIWVE